jgi:hypothetical protein
MTKPKPKTAVTVEQKSVAKAPVKPAAKVPVKPAVKAIAKPAVKSAPAKKVAVVKTAVKPVVKAVAKPVTPVQELSKVLPKSFVAAEPKKETAPKKNVITMTELLSQMQKSIVAATSK